MLLKPWDGGMIGREPATWVGVKNFRVDPRFHPTDVGLNLGSTRKFTTPYSELKEEGGGEILTGNMHSCDKMLNIHRTSPTLNTPLPTSTHTHTAKHDLTIPQIAA